MKVSVGQNPDYADYDEIDCDIEDAYEEFESGALSYEEFRIQVGPEAAQAFLERIDAPDGYNLLDDPEDF